MKAIRPLVCLFVLNALAGICGGEILQNPGFELGDKSGWTLEFDDQQPERWVVGSLCPYSGNYSLFTDWPKAVGQSFAPVAAAGLTEFSFWICTNLDTNLSVQLYYSDGTSTSNTVVVPKGIVYLDSGVSLTWSGGKPGIVFPGNPLSTLYILAGSTLGGSLVDLASLKDTVGPTAYVDSRALQGRQFYRVATRHFSKKDFTYLLDGSKSLVQFRVYIWPGATAYYDDFTLR